MTENKLTGKQQAFIDNYTDSSNDTYSNGYESAKVAGYKGNDNTLRAIASENLTKPNVKQAILDVRAEKQEERDHNRTIAIEMLTDSLKALESKIKSGNIQAIQARTAIIRELDAISNLHSSTLYTDDKQAKELDQSQAQASKELAAELNRQSLKVHRA